MFHTHPLPIVVIIGLALAGCSAPSPFDMASLPDVARHDLGSLTADESHALSRGLSTDPLPQRQADTEESLDSVDACVELALARNPSIAAARENILRLAQRLPQVASYDDPMLKLTPVGEMAQTAAGEVRAMSTLSQKIPFPGKLDARKAVAAQDVAIAREKLAATKLRVVANTKKAYWTLYDISRAIEITTQSKDLLTQLSQIVQSRYRAGKASQQSVLRLSVERHNLDNELIKLNARKATTIAMLNQLLDRPPSAPIADPAPIDLEPIDNDIDALLARGQVANPAIKQARKQVEKFIKQRELARFNRYPDLTTAITYNLVDDSGLSGVANGDDQWWLSFGINLPIWTDKLDAAERQAMRGVLQSTNQLADTQNQVAFAIQNAYLNIESTHDQARLLRDAIIPQAAQTLEASQSAYRSGRVDFLNLIENWRKLLTFQLMYQHTLATIKQRQADLELALGDLAIPSATPRAPSDSTEDDTATDPDTQTSAPNTETQP